MGSPTTVKERKMTVVWIVLALAVGIGVGFLLLAALQVSREEEVNASRAEMLLRREMGLRHENGSIC
jgi:hypothetical protein